MSNQDNMKKKFAKFLWTIFKPWVRVTSRKCLTHLALVITVTIFGVIVSSTKYTDVEIMEMEI